MYYRQHEKSVSSFDQNDTIGYVNKNKTRNCQLDAAEQYDAKMAIIHIRVKPDLKYHFDEN